MVEDYAMTLGLVPRVLLWDEDGDSIESLSCEAERINEQAYPSKNGEFSDVASRITFGLRLAVKDVIFVPKWDSGEAEVDDHGTQEFPDRYEAI